MNSKRVDCWYKDVCISDINCDTCARFMEMQHLMESSDIPITRQYPSKLLPDNVDYDAFYELDDIKQDIVSFVNNGENLYICSNNTGNGKTSWAIKLLTKYFDQIWAGNGFRTRGLLVHVPTLLMQLKDFDHPVSTEYRSLLLNTDLVVWDDIAHTGISKFDYNNLLMYIDNRMFQGKSNIFTSNVTMCKDLQVILGSKLASRIWQFSKIIEFKGKDRRG